MARELDAQQNAVNDVLQWFAMLEMIAEKDVVDHHGRSQRDEQERHGQEDARHLPLSTLLRRLMLRLVRGGRTLKVRRRDRPTYDETRRDQHDGERKEVVDDHVNLLPFGKDVMPVVRACVANETGLLALSNAVRLLVAVENEKMTVQAENDHGDGGDDVHGATGSAPLPVPEEKVNVHATIDADQSEIPRRELETDEAYV